MTDDKPIAYCMECGLQLSVGPRGGSSVNMACIPCHTEYNLAFFRGALIHIMEMHELDADRVGLFQRDD